MYDVIMKIYITRHGHRADDPSNPAGKQIPAGRPLDPDISSIGEKQATALGKRLRNEAQIKTIYASPFLRTAHTAHLIAKELGLRIKLEWAITESFYPQWFSEWPGTTERQKLAQMFDTIDLSYVQTGILPTCPEENQWRTNDRLILAMEKLAINEDTLIVTHALPMLLIQAGMAGWGEGEWNVFCCSLSCLEKVDDKWVSRLKCDGEHLKSIGLYL
jgi:ribonuclease H / adenosylcobalamin/alpha-ribazole phosphatase